MTGLKSVRYASAESGGKLALRNVTATVELKNPEPDDIFDPPVGPFAALPEPLRSVAAALPSGSARTICLAIAARLSGVAPTTPAPIAGFGFTFAPTNLPAVSPEAPPTVGDNVATFSSSAEISP